jgi:hypothetical protein
MLPSGDFPAACDSFHRRSRAWLVAGALFGLGGAAMAMPAWPDTKDEPARASPVPAIAIPATDPGGAAPSIGSGIRPAAASDAQRRMLMLLMMNSAGPLGPFGSLGH